MKTSAPNLLFRLLIAADVCFLVIHLVWVALPSPGHAFFSISTDLGYPEWFQYTKTFWMVLILLLLFQQTRHFFYLAWSFFWGYILFDDALQIHERVGVWLVNQLPSLSGVKDAKDVGELAVYIGIGVFFLVVLGVAHWQASHEQKSVSFQLALLAGLFLFFSVGMDMVGGLASSLSRSTLLNYGFSFLEDGGEMIVLSLAVSWLFAHLVNESFLPSDWLPFLKRLRSRHSIPRLDS